jgi:hypothetical protein
VTADTNQTAADAASPRMRTACARALGIALTLALLDAACGSVRPASTGTGTDRRLPADYLPLMVGSGRRYRPPATSARVRAAAPVGGLRCRRSAGPRFGAHLEIFVRQHVVAIPLGIGVTPPLTIVAARVRRGHCYYPIATTDPSGVLDVLSGARVTLGDVFDLWGQPLSGGVVAGFRAPAGRSVIAYVGTRRWHGDPRSIPLGRHERVVLELLSRVPPHRAYVFPPGL